MIKQREQAAHITKEATLIRNRKAHGALRDWGQVMLKVFDGAIHTWISIIISRGLFTQVNKARVKEAMFSIGENKSTGPDGYTSTFFKYSWDIVGLSRVVMVKWIMKCVSAALFSINVNGWLHGYFKGKRGLRQGDPLSPYLFTMVMEVLTLMLKRNIRREEAFQFHPKCERQEIINVCFADDLFMFSYVNFDFVKVISDALQEFKNCSGLVPSLPKSTAFFANVDCKILVQKVKNKIDDWKNKSLSFAGRIQLVASVLSPMQVYWSSIFILPKAIIKEIEAVSRGFLWCQGDMKRGKSKVKWDVVCLPKSEGGLGIRRLKTWNVALMTTHIWSILSNRQSLWVNWIYSYRLQERNFWDVPIKADSSYGWRKILQMRPLVRRFFFHVVGNGDQMSAWFDKWHDEGPFNSFITRRDIYRGVSRPTVRINFGGRIWRESSQISVAQAWQAIRPRAPEVEWFDVVWFSQCIPRHAFLVWLLIGEKLETQDKIRAWEVADSVSLKDMKCPLCNLIRDSHSHLFFECGISLQVWQRVKVLFHIPDIGNSWRSVVDTIQSSAHKKLAQVVVAKVLLVKVNGSQHEEFGRCGSYKEGMEHYLVVLQFGFVFLDAFDVLSSLEAFSCAIGT
ncbi:putative reverse transcriptase domain, reverse transcriptase zinc-binding domain protein [Tanacetum coccineum]|uniref:Reverse transcriptase domain, reverse transcriptase zinc-binding domain protein n=1 Tax=Tanacetum coccineum TaxID=301880 RepID=A0ABQ5G9F0_9ASTR